MRNIGFTQSREDAKQANQLVQSIEVSIMLKEEEMTARQLRMHT
jgi:hypothetical protein